MNLVNFVNIVNFVNSSVQFFQLSVFCAGAKLSEYAAWGKARGGRSKQASKCILLATSQWALGLACGFFVPRQICASALLEKKHVNWKVAAVAGFSSTGQGSLPPQGSLPACCFS